MPSIVGYCSPKGIDCVLDYGHDGNHLPKKHDFSDHLLKKGHPVRDLGDIKLLSIDKDELCKFETWRCMHRQCNYVEFRLGAGHN